MFCNCIGEGKREREKRSFQSRQIEFRGSFRPSVRPTQPLTRSPMRWSVAVVVSRSAVERTEMGDGVAAMAFVLMALHALLVGRLREEGKEGGGGEREGGH